MILFYNFKYKLSNILKFSAFKEAGFYGLSNFINQIMAFISMIFVSRYLGPANLGVISFVQNYASIFLAIVNSADYYFSWEIGKRVDRVSFIKEYIIHRLYIITIVGLFAILFAFYTVRSDLFLYIIIIISPFLLTSFSPFYLYAVYEKRAKLIFIFQSTSVLFLFLLKMLFVFLGLPVLYFIIVSALDIAIASLLYLLFYIYIYKSWGKVLFSLKLFSPLKTFKFYLSIKYAILYSMFWILLLRADQLILGFFSDRSCELSICDFSDKYNLGIYSAAVKLAEIPNSIAGIIYLVLLSRLTKMLKNNQEDNIKKVFRLYLYFGLIISILVFIFSEFLVNLVFGVKFYESASVLKIYGLSIIFVYVITFYTALFGAKDDHKSQFLILSLGVVLNIILVILFTGIWGLIGTAWATVISYGFVSIVFYFKSKLI